MPARRGSRCAGSRSPPTRSCSFLWCGKYGVPIGHDYIFLWIIIGLACASIGRTWKSMVHLLIDWGPFLLVVIAYDLSRGWADGAGFPVHFTPQIDADKVLFFGHVPTEWLERNLYHTDFVVGFSGGHLATAVQTDRAGAVVRGRVRPHVPVALPRVVHPRRRAVGEVACALPGLRPAVRDAERARVPDLCGVPRGSAVDGCAARVPRSDRRPHRRTRLRMAPPPHDAQHDRHRHQDDEPRRGRPFAARRVRDARRHHAVAERAEVVPALPRASIRS